LIQEKSTHEGGRASQNEDIQQQWAFISYQKLVLWDIMVFFAQGAGSR
jgi:hypothetical protein